LIVLDYSIHYQSLTHKESVILHEIIANASLVRIFSRYSTTRIPEPTAKIQILFVTIPSNTEKSGEIREINVFDVNNQQIISFPSKSGWFCIFLRFDFSKIKTNKICNLEAKEWGGRVLSVGSHFYEIDMTEQSRRVCQTKSTTL
jgi:hypothetical protein